MCDGHSFWLVPMKTDLDNKRLQFSTKAVRAISSANNCFTHPLQHPADDGPKRFLQMDKTVLLELDLDNKQHNVGLAVSTNPIYAILIDNHLTYNRRLDFADWCTTTAILKGIKIFV